MSGPSAADALTLAVFILASTPSAAFTASRSNSGWLSSDTDSYRTRGSGSYVPSAPRQRYTDDSDNSASDNNDDQDDANDEESRAANRWVIDFHCAQTLRDTPAMVDHLRAACGTYHEPYTCPETECPSVDDICHNNDGLESDDEADASTFGKWAAWIGGSIGGLAGLGTFVRYVIKRVQDRGPVGAVVSSAMDPEFHSQLSGAVSAVTNTASTVMQGPNGYHQRQRKRAHEESLRSQLMEAERKLRKLTRRQDRDRAKAPPLYPDAQFDRRPTPTARISHSAAMPGDTSDTEAVM